MLLSVIVPTYNVQDYLQNCLNSLLDQDLSKDLYEILVINDGSTDNSPKIASDFESNYSNVKLINQRNQGLSAARNTGIDHAIGKYIYFIDSDDYVSKNSFGLIMDTLEKNELDLLCLGIRQTSQLDIHDADNLDAIRARPVEVVDGITYLADNNYANNAWWYFINKRYLDELELKFPVGRFVEDANFTAEVIVNTKRMAYLPLDFYRYFIRPDSIMRKRDKKHLIKLFSDYLLNVKDFHAQIKNLKIKEHPMLESCTVRLKTRQESFVFFYIARFLKSDLDWRSLENSLDTMKEIGVYPMKNFPGKDYPGLRYSILTSIMNRKYLLRFFGKIFRFTYSLKR